MGTEDQNGNSGGEAERTYTREEVERIVEATKAETAMSDDERKLAGLIDASVARSLDERLPSAFDSFLDKLTSDDPGSTGGGDGGKGGNAPGGSEPGLLDRILSGLKLDS